MIFKATQSGLNNQFLILDMHVRNKKSGISSVYLPKLANAQHKKLKTYAVLVYGHVYITWSY